VFIVVPFVPLHFEVVNFAQSKAIHFTSGLHVYLKPL